MTAELRVQWIVDGVVGSAAEGWRSSLASNRYRVLSPVEGLNAAGLPVRLISLEHWSADGDSVGKADVVAIGKIAPGGDAQRVQRLCDHALAQIAIARRAGIRVVADFCDDHFDKPVIGRYWRALARAADLCIAGTAAMEQRLRSVAPAPVHVIGDPTFVPRLAPRVYRRGSWLSRAVAGRLSQSAGNARLRLIWYGNLNNWPALRPWAEALAPWSREQPWLLRVVTLAHPQVVDFVSEFSRRWAPQALIELVPWSEQAQLELVSESHVVLLPSDPDDPTKAVKTANRLSDALQCGCAVVASALPAYRPFAGGAYVGQPVLEALREYLDDPQAALRRIDCGQACVARLASQEVVAQQWLGAFRAAAAGAPRADLPTDAAIGTSGGESIEVPDRTVIGAASGAAPVRVFLLCEEVRPTEGLAWLRPLERGRGQGRFAIECLTESRFFEQFAAASDSRQAADRLIAHIERFAPDILVFCRYGGVHAERVLEWAQARQVRTVFSIDDDLLSVPDSFSVEKRAFHSSPQRLASIRMLLDEVDLVDCSSAHLGDRLAHHGVLPRRLHLRPFCGVHKLHPPPDNHPTVRIGYMGSADHERDLRMVVPALVRAMQQDAAIHFELVAPFGLPAELEAFGERATARGPEGNYTAFLEMLAGRRWDIGLCPLEVNDFNRGKNINKWLEYSAVGACVIASAGVTYDECCSGGGGVLVDEQGWEAAIAALVRSADRRRALVAIAQQRIAADFTLEKQSDRLERMLSELLGDAPVQHTVEDPVGGLSADLPVRLNLGCGDKILPGFVNVDVVEARAGMRPDVICDLHRLHPFADGSVDEVMAIHVVEHFWRWEVEAVLREWIRVLRPGGRMILECPNLLSAARELLANPQQRARGDQAGQRSMWVFYGDPAWKDPLMIHRWGYTPDSLADLMRSVGLVHVRQEPAQYKLREPRDMRLVGEKMS